MNTTSLNQLHVSTAWAIQSLLIAILCSYESAATSHYNILHPNYFGDFSKILYNIGFMPNLYK